ncbi:uncharacterized protein LOC134743611 isoform X1 [Cydia strobilella]|uniref:uncharacterized protein LOC134743611 isoform X1 n=2 Tax=Cydia strobilella TaxID=1100964 RepID=UPI003004E45C
MWYNIQEDPPYLLLAREVKSYEVYVTDYISIWFVYFKKNDFLECLKDSNFGLEVEPEELLQKGAKLLKQPTNLRKVEIKKSVSTLEISVTKLFEYSLQLQLKLSEGSKEMFFQNVTYMLLKTVADLKTSQQELRDLLKKKDDEIEEYKSEGKEIALRYLKTKQFNDEEHMRQHQVDKECADLLNIPNTLLDKIVAATHRNEAMSRLCADAVLCLKQTVRHYTDRRTAIYACFLDFKKTFNQIPYDKLWQKMRSEPVVPDEIVVMLEYFYKNQLNTRPRPRLFNPYLYCLFEQLSNARVGCCIQGKIINHISFKDNLVLLGPWPSAIIKLLQKCEDYAKENGFRFNVNKSKLLVFQSPRGRKITMVPRVYLHGTILGKVSRYKYLDHWLSEYLSDSDDFSDMDSDEFSNSDNFSDSED